jgi:hypothetical protein
LDNSITWNICQGGSGFKPPYVFPNPQKMAPPQIPLSSASASPFQQQTPAAASSEHSPMSGMMSETAQGGGDGVCQVLACEPPPAVFCSRELEKDLSEFVTSQVAMLGREGFPSAAAIRQRARVFWNSIPAHAGEERTPADDEVLLAKFRDMMHVRLGLGQPSSSSSPQNNRGVQQGGQMSQLPFETGSGMGIGTIVEMDCPNLSATVGLGPITEMDCPGAGVGLSQSEIDDMLQEMDFDFGNMDDYLGIATGGMAMDQ